MEQLKTYCIMHDGVGYYKETFNGKEYYYKYNSNGNGKQVAIFGKQKELEKVKFKFCCYGSLEKK